jgi:hypothetical protein
MQKQIEKLRMFLETLGFAAVYFNFSEYKVDTVVLDDNAIYPGPYKMEGFIWQSSDGRKCPITELHQSHLSNAINKLTKLSEESSLGLERRYNELRVRDWIDLMRLEQHCRTVKGSFTIAEDSVAEDRTDSILKQLDEDIVATSRRLQHLMEVKRKYVLTTRKLTEVMSKLQKSPLW